MTPSGSRTEVAGALDYAHRHDVIHRDIKPENILLHDGRALVADFGIALAASNAGGSRMTETGCSLGTPQYMSPEQATGERSLDARSDIYSLGCVLYEMLAGDPPFTGPYRPGDRGEGADREAAAGHARAGTVPPRSMTRFSRRSPSSPPIVSQRPRSLRRRSGRGEPREPHRDARWCHRPCPRAWTVVPRPAWGLRPACRRGAGSGGWSPTERDRRAGHPVRASPRSRHPVRVSDDRCGDLRRRSLPMAGRWSTPEAGASDWALYIRNLDQLDARLLPGTEGATSPEFSPERELDRVRRGRWEPRRSSWVDGDLAHHAGQVGSGIGGPHLDLRSRNRL